MKYEKKFKQEAVRLSDEIGIKKASQQLGIPYYTLADWRHRQNVYGEEAHVGSGHKRQMNEEEKDRRIREPEQKGIECSRSTVYRRMKEGGYLHRKRAPHGITKASLEEQRAENLIKRDFHAEKPIAKLLSDVSEIQCRDGKLYISPILDCYNGEIVALEVRDNMKKELCIDTVKQLKYKYGDLRNVILHTDRGCQ